MLFRKLRIERTPDSKVPVEKWYMILRTFQDVLEYTQIDFELFKNALFALPDSLVKSHLEGAREIILNMAITTNMMVEGKDNCKPLDIMNKIVLDKAKNMVEMIANGEEVLVQQIGSYCSYNIFIDIWDIKVVEEMEQNNCYFPTDTAIIETEILFIENGERVPVDFERKVKTLVGFDWNDKNWTYVNNNFKRELKDNNVNKVLYKLTHLKLRDPEFIVGMVKKAKAIAVQTELADQIQLDTMMGLFSQLPEKTIYIKTSYWEQLQRHSLFEICNQKHKINLVD